MSLKNKAMALGLSAAMLLSPAASLAESNYAAGELTTTAISDSYAAGNQLNLSADFSLELGDAIQNLGDAKLQKKVKMCIRDSSGPSWTPLSVSADIITAAALPPGIPRDSSGTIAPPAAALLEAAEAAIPSIMPVPNFSGCLESLVSIV